MEDLSNAGQGRTENPAEPVEKQGGTYHDAVEDVPVEKRTQIETHPQAPDKSPINWRG